MNNNTDHDDFVLGLAGNKCDIDKSKHVITKAMCESIIDMHDDMIHCETSARTGEGL
jgi:hypothetical protein